MQIGDQFSSIEVARNAIQRYTLDDGESYRVLASDKKRYIIVCKAASQTAYKFQIRATQSAKGVTSITILVPYYYSLATYYNNSKSSSLWYYLLAYLF